jgi:molecular chaperone Hsp33
MTETDNLQRFIFENASVRGEYIHLAESFQTIIAQHGYPPAIQKLLGEALCVAGLLTAIIKFNGRLSVQFRGKGKLKMLLAQCDSKFSLRGLVKWDGELSYDDLMESFNDGVLMIMLNSDNSTKSYQGVVGWRGNSLVESIEGYFKDSEQLVTKLWLSVDQHSAAGLLLQVMPTEAPIHDMGQEMIDMQWHHIVTATNHVQKADMLHLGYENLLRKLYPQEDVRVFDPQPVAFRCTCTRKRGEEAIALLGQEEAEEELKEKQVLIVTCDFCNKEYVFDKVDVAAIFANKGPPSNADLH